LLLGALIPIARSLETHSRSPPSVGVGIGPILPRRCVIGFTLGYIAMRYIYQWYE
jgi:hypothetical protein